MNGTYFPEGIIISDNENRTAFSCLSSLRDAALRGTVLEAVATKCDRDHALHVDLGIMQGIIPKNEGAIGIEDGSVRDIALISRVGKPVCFVVTEIKKNADGKLYAVLSRRKAQEKCRREYIDALLPGDVITVRVTRTESFGVFCDIGCGIPALIPIDAVSVSRIPHPSARFFNGQIIKAIIKSRDGNGRITLTHKELLGTWKENAAKISVGETVPGIVRSVESYGIFVELAPNLAGLAEYDPDIKEGQSVAVFIKSIIPEKMKIKLVIVDKGEPRPPEYVRDCFFRESHMTYFRYSPPECDKVVETVFGI